MALQGHKFKLSRNSWAPWEMWPFKKKCNIRNHLKQSYLAQWVGVGGFSKVVATFNHYPIFSNLGLCAARWACFMCHRELWPTSVRHPFSSLNSSLSFAGGKHYQKITIPIFRPVLQNFVIPGYKIHNSFQLLPFLLTFFRLVCYCNVWLYFSQGSS